MFDYEDIEDEQHCAICNSDRNVIKHHVNYKENITIPLCRGCHMMLHNGAFLALHIPAPQHPYCGRYGKPTNKKYCDRIYRAMPEESR